MLHSLLLYTAPLPILNVSEFFIFRVPLIDAIVCTLYLVCFPSTVVPLVQREFQF